jgi:hypothetical protein
MAALIAVSITLAGVTPTAVVANATDTIAAGQFGANGVILRVTNAGGSPDNITVVDPNRTLLGYPGEEVVIAVPAAGVRQILIPITAIDQATGLATINHSFTTSVSQEVARI